MDKAEQIKYLEETNQRTIESVRKLPDAAFEIPGMGISVSFNYVRLYYKAESMQEALEVLSKTKSKLGAYKINSYWVPYETCVCVTYTFGEHELWFSIESEDLEDARDMISSFSGGKCDIVEDASLSVVCGI